jgi:hypothetical protein
VRTRLKKRVALLVAAWFTIHLGSCGTLLHPERRGQPAGRLDPGIVVLDAVGLLLFFVPGVIAFAVDFSNGTIYLPPESAAAPVASGELRTIRMSPAELTPERLEDVIHRQTGQTIRLEPGAYRATRLQQIEDFSGMALERFEHAPGATSVSFGR